MRDEAESSADPSPLAKGMVTTMNGHGKTLAPKLQTADPYGWLSGDEKYQVPVEWLTLMADSPERHSARILASIDEQSFARYAVYNFTNRVMSAYGMRPDDEFMAETAPCG